MSIKIEVIDQGIGIKNTDNLFIPFSKLNETKKINKEGTGLGLSICKHMIEQMGGSVHVSSEHGKGTTFKYFIRTTLMVDKKLLKKLHNLDEEMEEDYLS